LKLRGKKSNLMSLLAEDGLHRRGNCAGKTAAMYWLDASWAEPVTTSTRQQSEGAKQNESLMHHKLLISTQIVFVPYIHIFSRCKIS
jgi:hypothetical protein